MTRICYICAKEINDADLDYIGGAYPVHKHHDKHIDLKTAKIVDPKTQEVKFYQKNYGVGKSIDFPFPKEDKILPKYIGENIERSKRILKMIDEILKDANEVGYCGEGSIEAVIDGLVELRKEVIDEIRQKLKEIP